MYFLLLAVLALLECAWSIPVDNGLEGDPKIQCGAADISVVFATRNPFEGHVYVKGLYESDGCRVSGTAGITLPFDSCNVIRERALEPRGVFVRATLIIQFHPIFTTKVDRAFRFNCFYMETDKTVSQEFEVSPLTTVLQTLNVPMPVCRYEILDGPVGDPLKYVIVGEAVYHKWTCVTDTTDTFCMIVHSCTVDDGAGNKVDLLNEQGCAFDKYLLRNLEYLSDVTGGQETHVFKFADRNQLYFQCQLAIIVKEPNGECPTPSCPALRSLRQRRSSFSPETVLGTVDVTAIVDALSVMDDQTFELPNRLDHKDSASTRVAATLPFQPKNSFCVSSLTLGTSLAMVLCCLFSAAFSSTMLFIRRSSKQSLF